MSIEIANAYQLGQLQGWNKELGLQQFELFRGSFPKFEISNQTQPTAGRKMMLYKAVRAGIGKDTPNYPQEIGDCTSFGMKNAIEYLQCCQMVIGGQREAFELIFPPYIYGAGRVLIDGERSWQDGSTGTTMANAVRKYGVLPSDESGCPEYTGKVASKWGHDGPPNNFVQIASKNLVKTTAQIRNWDDLVAAIVNGYPCTVASNQGFEMQAGSDGFHRASGSWSHQMCFVGVDETYTKPYVLILNSWGDCFGQLKDFENGENLPVGVIRALRDDIEPMIDAGETYAISGLDGFPEQPLDEALFKLI